MTYKKLEGEREEEALIELANEITEYMKEPSLKSAVRRAVKKGVSMFDKRRYAFLDTGR